MQQLVVRHAEETSLSVSWKQPLGEWDGFTVAIRQKDQSTILTQKVLSREAKEYTFKALSPGCLYSVTVTTNSGKLSSSASVTAWTSTSGLFA